MEIVETKPGQLEDASGASGLLNRIVPCLDVRDGRVVKGVRFQGLRDAGDPAELARRYADQGADEIVILDVSATPEGRRAGLETIEAVRGAIAIPLTVGGGVRAAEDAARLLTAGADKVGVNTAAVRTPPLLDELAARFGRQCVVLAIDAARRTEPRHPEHGPADGGSVFEVVVHSGKERTGRCALAWAEEGMRRGAGEILLTSWDKDGTRSGYDTEMLRAVRERVTLPLIASGGAASSQDLLEAFEAGADAALAASIFHDGDLTVGDVKTWLLERGQRVRR